MPCKHCHSAAVLLITYYPFKPDTLRKSPTFLGISVVSGIHKDASAHSSFWQLRSYPAELLLLISLSDEGNEEGQAWQDLAEGF